LHRLQTTEVTVRVGKFLLEPHLYLDHAHCFIFECACQLWLIIQNPCLVSDPFSSDLIGETSIYKFGGSDLPQLYSAHAQEINVAVVTISPDTDLNFRFGPQLLHNRIGQR